jgi:hypothetical protein
VQRWNAKQRALGHLHRIAAIVHRNPITFKDDGDWTNELIAAMLHTPGLPYALRPVLEDGARPACNTGTKSEAQRMER